MFKTRMTEILGTAYPIQVGTMMHINNADFVAACANAGVFACLVSAMFPDEKTLSAEIEKLRSLTDKPFGVNVALFPGADARTADVTFDILADMDVKNHRNGRTESGTAFGKNSQERGSAPSQMRQTA